VRPRHKVLGKATALEMPAAELAEVRAQMKRRGIPGGSMSDDELRRELHQRALDFRDKAPVSAAAAATTILDGVRRGEWRILVGDDAQALDRMVREDPLGAYSPDFPALVRR
jgi:hypothetical protein